MDGQIKHLKPLTKKKRGKIAPAPNNVALSELQQRFCDVTLKKSAGRRGKTDKIIVDAKIRK